MEENVLVVMFIVMGYVLLHVMISKLNDGGK